MALKRPDAPAKRSKDAVKKGTGADDYKVKGSRATAKQRETIDGVLTQCADDKASRRVMVAAIMCITQESVAGDDQSQTGNDDVGIYQQGRNWISVEGSKDPGQSTHAFLITGPTSWKKVHRSVKKAPGNLSLAIHAVQGNKDANAYAQWEGEASNTVDTWLGNGGGADGSENYIKRYSFTRGEKGGQRENSWDAAQRLVEEVGAFRWAAANVFYAVSGDELRAGASSLLIDGSEAWMTKQPAWSWASSRAISEVTLQALAGRWDFMPGAAVTLHRRFGAMSGRWLVWNVSGTSLDSPEVTIVLRRPTRLKDEPAPEVGTRGGSTGSGGLEDICKQISDNRSTYLLGGAHGPKLANVKSSDHMDCSSSVSLALYRAKLFNGQVAIVSGEFASSWGKPGKGKDFTVWANAEHVWMEGYDSDGKFAWRFDTSHHGGQSGPAHSTKPRSDQARFTARHWSG